MSIVITGAGGQLGRLTAEHVLDRLPAADVVLVTRRPEALADLAERGADVRRGDFNAPETLRAAFAGARRLLLTSTDAVGRRVPQHRVAIEAARAAGVEHVVYTSLASPTPENPAVVTHEHRETEDLLRAGPLAWTSLRNAIYLEHQLPAVAAAAASGALVDNRGDGRAAFVTRDDCAAVAAAVLAGEGHEGRAYEVTGPELLASADVAAHVADVTGRAVRHRHLDDEAYAEHLRRTGLPEHRVEVTVTLGRAIREGHMAALTPVVEELTGRKPGTLRDVLEERRAELADAPATR